MSPGRWWAGAVGEPVYGIAEAASRDEVVREACRNLAPGDTFRIVEARSSEAAKHEGAEVVPFLRTRNEETITVGPRP